MTVDQRAKWRTGVGFSSGCKRGGAFGGLVGAGRTAFLPTQLPRSERFCRSPRARAFVFPLLPFDVASRFALVMRTIAAAGCPSASRARVGGRCFPGRLTSVVFACQTGGRLTPMTITIDSAGRMVIPKALRDELGIHPGMPLSVTSDGVGLRVEPMRVGGRIVERDGRLAIASASGRTVTDDEIREAMDAGRC